MPRSVSEAIIERRSVRAFLDKPVPEGVIEALIASATRAPSGGNLQPWHIDVVMGARLDELKALMIDRTRDDPRGEPMDYTIYPTGLSPPYEDRRKFIGEAMYGKLGIPYEDRTSRRAWFTRNFQFFGAPVGIFCHIDRSMGPPQWSDLGMFLQSLMLLAVEAGLATCAQECWAMYPRTVGAFLRLREDHILFCGMALGYEDSEATVNTLHSPREDITEILTIHR